MTLWQIQVCSSVITSWSLRTGPILRSCLDLTLSTKKKHASSRPAGCQAAAIPASWRPPPAAAGRSPAACWAPLAVSECQLAAISPHQLSTGCYRPPLAAHNWFVVVNPTGFRLLLAGKIGWVGFKLR